MGQNLCETVTARWMLDRFGPTMTPVQVAEMLGKHPTPVREMCASGELPAIKIGGRWRIPTVRLATMLDGGTATCEDRS